VPEADALAVLDAAVQAGVTLIDTADVYGDGRSEQRIGTFLRANPGSDLFVADQNGPPLQNFRLWTDRSRRNLGVEVLDLVQLHCPPTVVYSSPQVYDALDALVAEERIAAYGVSVETVEEALTAIARRVASVQIILNAFRQKPLEKVLPAAIEAEVGMLARVPLASGLLPGRYAHDTQFAGTDHRSYNRHGEAFDVGETFSGVDFDAGVEAARELAALAPPGVSAAQLALRRIVDQPGVTAVIPGARTAQQARDNATVDELGPLDAAVRTQIAELHDRRIRPSVHARW
jgi:aryl-alcohol dehydrogenase-like predicted oxidoreductase